MQTYFKKRHLSTGKMDDLTKQLFEDVKKEQQQRLYERWVALQLPLSLSAVLYFASWLADSRSQAQESGMCIFVRSEDMEVCESECPPCAPCRHCPGSAMRAGDPGNFLLSLFYQDSEEFRHCHPFNSHEA